MTSNSSTGDSLENSGRLPERLSEKTPKHHEHSEDDNNAISKDITALYGLLAVVAGVCVFPLVEAVEHFNTDLLRWVETIYLVIAIGFLLFCFAFLFRPPTTKYICGPAGEIPESPNLFNIAKMRLKQLLRLTSPEDEVCVRYAVGRHLTQQVMDSGSLYLKVGCVIFGVGSLVYCSLTLGIFTENHRCFAVVLGINPILLMLFIALQLLFIFINSQFTITRYIAVGRLGLMHLIVVNLLICLRVVVDETVHSFHGIAEKEGIHVEEDNHSSESEEHKAPARLGGGTGAYLSECVRSDSIMKQALATSTIFLYPCIVEYALISAGIVYTMWRGLGHNIPEMDLKPLHKNIPQLRAKSAFRINCDQALGGMFVGLLVVACVLVGLIIFFIAVSNPNWTGNATLAWITMDIGLHSLGTVAAVYCAIRFVMKMARIHVHSLNLELDETLLMFAMIGVYAYNITSLLATAQCTSTAFGRMGLASGILGLVQATAQSVFLFDAGKRGMKKSKPGDPTSNHKPGRQMLTFLLILNFALWAVNVFCALRIDGSPCEVEFFGGRIWALITHVTVPLIIFYRFHSTACIFEVWKRAYRVPKEKESLTRIGSILTVSA